jgi:fructose-specific phosphotransferase system IIC component
MDRHLMAFYPLLLLTAPTAYSAWAVFSNRPWAEAIARFIPALGGMLSFALVLSPILLPAALLGWAVTWSVLRLAGLHGPVQALFAGAVAGLCAALPLTYAFRGPDNDSAWQVLVYPLLWIAPVSGAIAAWVVYRKT